ADLVELVDGHERGIMQTRRHLEAVEQGTQELPVIQSDPEVAESECVQYLGDGDQDLRLDDWRRRSDRVDVALIELAKAAARRAIGAPHRLNLIPLEELRQLVLVLCNDARERDGEVVAQREVGLAGVLVLAALENFENELVAFFAVLAEQRLDVLECRRLEGLEAVALVDVADDADHVLP